MAANNTEILPLHGWLPIAKPAGMTSFDVIKRLKKHLPRKHKIGHAGTLDPEATGLLLVAVGEATKLIPYAQEMRKTYLFQANWGEQRTTDDHLGACVARSARRPTRSEVEALMPCFLGKQQQRPPNYSAKKIAGKRACDLMRRGSDDFGLQDASISIDALEIVKYASEQTQFLMTCSKGTYVRSVVRDMGFLLETYGYASQIHRRAIGGFQAADAMPIEMLANGGQKGVMCILKPAQAVLDDIPAVLIDPDSVTAITRGQAITAMHSGFIEGQRVRLESHSGTLIALGAYHDGFFSPKRVFPGLIET